MADAASPLRSARLFGRQVVLTVETRRITGLRISFAIKKTSKADANTAEVKVWNLAEDTRKFLQATKTVRVLLEAAYQDNIAQIFSGGLRNATSTQDGPYWVTKVESGDGENEMRIARVNKSFQRATFEILLKEAAKQLGVGLGNLGEVARAGKFQDALRELSRGVILNGPAVEVIDRLTRSAGYTWSVQDGQLQFVERGKAIARTAIVLSPSTGLIGSPELGEKGVVKLRSLLQPELIPGRKVQLKSRQFDALFVCETVAHVGDTAGQDWYSNVEAKPL